MLYFDFEAGGEAYKLRLNTRALLPWRRSWAKTR